MCESRSLAHWLGELPKEQAWMNGAVITRLSFSFYSGEVTMMVKRLHKTKGKQICWITQSNPRECMQYLWRSYSTKRTYIEWKEDTYKA